MPNKENLSEEEYLKKHLGNIDNQNQKPEPSFEDNTVKESATVDQLQYFSFDPNELPCGNFYPSGSSIMVRPAQVKEIQAYSMVDDENFYDIVDKMNHMLKSCIRIKHSDGRMSSYLDIKDQDRLYLIFLIRELTFQKGNSLTVKAKCDCDDTMIDIELTRDNFVFHEIDEKLKKYFNYSNNSYLFKLKNGKSYELTPPNIGLQKSFTDYIIKETNEKGSPNLSFLKIIPFLLPGRSSISNDGVKAKLAEFEEMDDISFQFLNSAVGKMTFGIKELKKICECGSEVRTEMTFPNGASGIFVIHDAFEAYIEE